MDRTASSPHVTDRAPLRVAMRPVGRVSNPYPRMLADALAANGVDVTEMNSGPRSYASDADVVFYHWPDMFFHRESPAQSLRALMTLARIALARRGGQRLVWLVHNLVPHDRARPPFALGRAGFLSQLDGAVYLSEASRALAAEHYPRLSRIPALVIPHGRYDPRPGHLPGDSPPLAGRAARLALIGNVRRYKNPEALAAAVARTADAELRIAGECREPALAQALEAVASPRVALDLAYQSDDDLERAVEAADAVVQPYREILNSGSVLYALSRRRPVMAPRMGSLEELQAQVGRDWLWLYDGDFSDAVLCDFLVWLRARPAGGAPDLSAHDWQRIGAELAGFLRGLRSGPG